MVVTWGQWLALLGTVITVVGVPVFYMRKAVCGIQSAYGVMQDKHDDLVRQLQSGAGVHATLERRIGYVERDYATKEEWVRESAAARRDMAGIREMLAGLQAAHDAETGLAAMFGKMTEAIVEAVRQRDE